MTPPDTAARRRVEIRAYRLKPGTRADFHAAVTRDALPMVRAYGMDVVTHGPVPNDENGYFLVRSNLKSHSVVDVQRSITYGKRVKFYPVSQANNPPDTVFTDVKDEAFDSTIKYDLSFFTLLDQIIQRIRKRGRSYLASVRRRLISIRAYFVQVKSGGFPTVCQ